MDLRELKKAKKREKLLMKQLQQERVNEKCSEWEELNMNQELHPIRHYINDREEMIKQMFNVVSERQLMKMLPPGLKGMSVEELQADCLIQLVGMSKKRIMAILEGRELDSSSESPSESDLDGMSMEEESEPEPIIVKVSKNKKAKKASKRTATTTLEDIQKPAVLSSKKVKTKHRVKKEKIEVIESGESDGNDVEDTDIAATIKKAGVSPEKENIEHKGKTLLEILELEMRAKAIRALLEREKQPEEGKQLKDLSNKKPESEKIEKIMPTTVEEVVDNVKESITDKSNESVLPPSANEKDSEDIVILDEEIVKIDLTSDDDTPSKAEETSSKSANIIIEKEPSVNAQPTIVLQTASPSTSTEISCERISSTVEKSSASPEKSNWAQRWLDSSKVKKVVSTSKMCTNIRRKIKKSLMLKSKQVEESQQVVEETPVIPIQEFSGSTQEYEILKKLVKKKKNDNLANQANSDSQENVESQLQENSESNQQEDAKLELQENSESRQEEHTESSLQEDVESQPLDNRASNLREDSESQPQDNRESNLQEDLETQPREIRESNLKEDSDSQPPDNRESNLKEDSDSQPQDNRDSSLQEDVESQPQDNRESNLQEDLETQPKEIRESNLKEDSESQPQDKRESDLQEDLESLPPETRESNVKEDSDLQPRENRESNLKRDSESQPQDNRESNLQEDLESLPPENRESNLKEGSDSQLQDNREPHIQEDKLQLQGNSDMEQTENIQSNSQECSRSSSYEASESNEHEISELKGKNESIPDESRESNNSHEDKESSLQENSELNSDEDMKANHHKNSRTLNKSCSNSSENSELDG